MNDLLQITLGVIALAGAGALLRISMRWSRLRLRHLVALTAWIPVWLLTHTWLWTRLTHHFHATGYPGWFWSLLFVGLVVGIIGIFVDVLRLVTFVIGVVLVVTAFWNVNWFGPVVRHPLIAALAGIIVLLGLGLVVLFAVLGWAWKVVALVAAAILVVFAGIPWLWTEVFDSNGHHHAGTSTGTSKNKTLTPKQQVAAEAQLTVTASGVNCNALVFEYGGKLVDLVNAKTKKVVAQTPAFHVGASDSVGPRLWSDAVNVPLKPRELEAEQAVVCRDPAQAAMVMNGLGSQQPITGGPTVVQLNPWMKAQGSPSVISKWAQSCMTQSLSVHIQCANAMAWTATLLGRFHDDGIKHSPDTKWYYHLAGGGLVVGTVPPFAVVHGSYSGYFMVLSVTEKTGGCFLKVGFNVGKTTLNGGDQRLAGLACAHPHVAPPAHKKTPSKTTPSSKTPHPTTPTHPPTSTHPSTPPTSSHKTCLSVFGPGYSGTYPNCHKDGATSVQPTQPTSAPGTNPSPNPTSNSGSNECYSETTGLPVPPNPDGTCPAGSFGG